MRYDVISKNAEFLKDKLFMEFGVWSGTSISNFRDLYKGLIPSYEKKLYGFDSFVGLPEETHDKNNPLEWFAGQYTSNGVVPSLPNPDDFLFIEGWFSDVLTDDFARSIITEKVGLLHLDCDIYTSTYQVLDFMFKHELLTSGSILMYDDWGGHYSTVGEGREYDAGQGLAHADIMKKYNRNCEMIHKIVVKPNYYEIAVFVLP